MRWDWFYRIRGFFTIRPPRWLVVTLGLAALFALIWWAGPLFAFDGKTPLAGEWARVIAFGVVLLVAAAVWGFRRWRAGRENRALVGDLEAAGTGEAAAPVKAGDPAADDRAAMEERAAKALAMMRTARVGKDKAFVYELPWFVIIGPPGAGKTTLLKNAGLDFPAAQEIGDGPVRGLGGTRTIEWWFTNRAVLIDTAGRYTTQDSDEAADAGAWRALLDLLKRHRPRQPVTGILVAISVTDLIGADESAALAHGRAVRQRLNEVQEAFGAAIPVYVMLTKLDLLAGFAEFFDDLPQGEREQVWGSTFELDGATRRAAEAGDDAAFDRAFDALLARLESRVLLRVQAENDMARRGLIFGFPQQFASLRAPLRAMLRLVARETRFEPTPLVRGFYFTSATQFGRPVDRLMAAISQRVGFAMHGGAAGETARGRAFFVHDLLVKLVFGEAAIAGLDPAAEKRRRLLRLGALGAAAAAALALATLWTLSYFRNAALVERLETRGGVLREQVARLGDAPIADADPLRPLAALDTARALPFASTAPAADRSPGFSWGVGRQGSLRPQVDGAYRNLLNRQLLPRLLLTLEGEIARLNDVGAAPGTPDDPRADIYNLLRVYLMLGRAPRAPMEQRAIQAWFADHWADAYPAGEQAPARASLERHLATMLAGPLTPPRLNAPLIAAARQRVATLGPGERIYVRMLADETLRGLAPFRLTDVPGVATSGLFKRRSGAPISDGVPGMFRRANLYGPALNGPVLRTITEYSVKGADESWVTGEPPAAGGALAERGRVKDALLTAYLADFTRRWDDYIDDIAVSGERPLRDRILLATRPPSPVRALFSAMANETDLTPPSLKQGSSTRAAIDVAGVFSRRIYNARQRADQVASAARTAPQGPPGPLDEVVAHFRWLREMLPASGQGPLDQALGALAAVGESGGAAAAAAGLGNPALQQQSTAAAMAATARLGQVTAALPPQAGAIFQGFTKASATELNRQARDQVRDQYGEALLPECQSITSGGYPFAGSPARQVSVDDFSRLFRPDGLLDQFQKTALAGQIDTAGAQWRLSASGRALGLNPAAVGRLQDGARIRAAFFKPGDIRPNVRFTVELVRLSPDAQGVTLDVDGVPAAFMAGSARPVDLRWPGPTPGVGVAFARAGQPAAIPARRWTGDWAFATMLRDVGRPGPGKGVVLLQLADGPSAATLRLRMADAVNPFAAAPLERFRCPTRI